LFTSAGAIPEPLRAQIGPLDIALVYSTSRDLVHRLAALVPRVLAHDPTPPPGAGHASRWLAVPLAGLGVNAAEDPPPCEPTADERAACASLAGRLPSGFLAVHPGSGSPRKNWPADRFAALLDRTSPDRPWLLVEGPADADAVAGLARMHGARRASELAPRTLGALLSQAGAYVGNDSGVTHLAAAWGAPTLALFGPTSPDVWSPLGPRVRTLRSPSAAMAGLDVEAVHAALSELATCSGRGLPSG
jgi:hypothetical protein